MQGNAQFSLSGGVERIERLEVIAGPTGRRSWSDEAKGRVVLESHGLGARVVDVARRHGVAAQQVTTWRREARQGKLALPVEDEAAFAVLTLDAAPEATSRAPRPTPPCAPLEIEQDGVIVRLPSDAAPERIAAVVAALRKPR